MPRRTSVAIRFTVKESFARIVKWHEFIAEKTLQSLTHTEYTAKYPSQTLHISNDGKLANGSVYFGTNFLGSNFNPNEHLGFKEKN